MFLILHDLPLSLDDYLFQSTDFESLNKALHYVVEFGNGRFLGNGGSIILLHHRVLGDIVRAVVLAGVAILLPLVLSLQNESSFVLSMILFLTIAPGIFGEVYSWMSGFQNYVPPILLLLVVLLMIRGEENRSLAQSPAGRVCSYITIFILSLCMQFYIEHSSCLNVLTAFLMTVWTRKRKCFKASLFFLVGTFTGLVFMIYAMLFLAPEIWGGVQSYIFGSLSDVARGCVRNAVLLLGMYSENAVALCAHAILCSLLLARYPEAVSKKTRLFVYSGMLGPSVVFLIFMLGSLKPFYGKLAVGESGLIFVAMVLYMTSNAYVLICLAKYTKRQSIVRAAVLFMMAIVSIIPILAVWPTGYRCLFHSCVMLFGAVLLLAEEVQEEAGKRIRMTGISIALTGAFVITVLCQIVLFSDIRRMVSIRDDYLKEQVNLGADSAAYFLIPSPYLHEVWNVNKEHSTTINGQNMKLDIIPADVWLRIYYYHYM